METFIQTDLLWLSLGSDWSYLVTGWVQTEGISQSDNEMTISLISSHLTLQVLHRQGQGLTPDTTNW